MILLGNLAVVQAQGVVSPSAGPINSSMAGASLAAPVDFGASYWNPAIISALDDQEFLLGSALV
jgi:long-chain fatty acid transport protein